LPRWKTAAAKNAYVLLSQQRYALASAMFILGTNATYSSGLIFLLDQYRHENLPMCPAGSLRDAIRIILGKMHDIQVIKKRNIDHSLFILHAGQPDGWGQCRLLAAVGVDDRDDARADAAPLAGDLSRRCAAARQVRFVVVVVVVFLVLGNNPMCVCVYVNCP
jgi:hypothetical protein